MRVKSRQVTEFPLPMDQETSPYGLNQFTPSARSLSDFNSCCNEKNDSLTGSKIPVRMTKVVFVGDVGVGKTSIINKFSHDIFDLNYKNTVGVDYEMIRFWILNVPLNLQIWDTAGQERFKCIAASYYRGSNVVVTVFDASNLESLSTCQRWMDDVVGANPVVPLKFLVATKMDLVNESHRDKIFQMGNRMANLLGAEFWTISSKTGENVEDVFRRIAVLAFETSLAKEVEENLARPTIQIQRHMSVLRPSFSEESNQLSNRIEKRCASCKN